jgi:hypothetical protein
LENERICEECENINGFKYCVSCHGENCVTYNKNALDYCNQKHFVYLAYFPKDIVKVGTAHEMRKEERLIEQGALYRILIAEAPTGKTARQIENAISKLGYKSAVSSRHKIQNLQFTKTETEIRELLDIAYKHIQQNLNNEFQDYLLSPYIYSNNKELVETLTVALKQTKQQQLSFFDDMVEPEYQVISNVSSIDGEIVAVIGSIMLVKNGKILRAYNLKELYGRDIIMEHEIP